MTEIGYDLTIDGTIAAKQASKAGEAVVLGSDGLIPADLLPKTSGGGIPYFYVEAGKAVNVEDGLVSNNITRSIRKPSQSNLYNTFGTYVNEYAPGVILPGLGPVAVTFAEANYPGASEDATGFALTSSAIELILNSCVRTNLRGSFNIGVYLSEIGYPSYLVSLTNTAKISITDSGIEWISGNWYAYLPKGSTNDGKVGIGLNSLSYDFPEWS